MCRAFIVAVVLLPLAPAVAEPIPFAVDEAASSGAISATGVFLGQSSSDSADSGISGSGAFTVTQDPATIAISALQLALDPALQLGFSFSVPFVGNVPITIDAQNVVITYVGEGTAPVAVAGNGSFTLAGLPFAASGTVVVTSQGAAVDTINLSEFEAQPVDVTGTVGFSGDEAIVTLDTAFEGSQTFEVVGLPATVTFSASATAVLRATIAEPCPADFNGDTMVNVSDLLAFLGAYRNGDASANVNGDGAINVSDLLAFLGAYRNGC